jgi:hypothetical protein
MSPEQFENLYLSPPGRVLGLESAGFPLSLARSAERLRDTVLTFVFTVRILHGQIECLATLYTEPL